MPRIRTFLYTFALIWLNVYIVRDLFVVEHTGHMNAMHGFWMALARMAPASSFIPWLTPAWWPYWDAGMPFESTYAPGIPALLAAWSSVAGVSTGRAFHSVAGFLYVLAPVSAFAMATACSRRPGWSFVGAVVYSLVSPTQLIIPDEPFAWSRIGDARRMYLTVVWDEVPHLAALSLVPLVVLFTTLAMRTGRRLYWIAAGAFTVAALLANAFGLTAIAIAMLCVWLTMGRVAGKSLLLTAICSYLVACPFLPPSLFGAISRNQQFHGAVDLGPGSFTAISLVVLGTIAWWFLLARYGAGTWVRFLGLFTWITLSIPFIATYLNRSFLPQSVRYKMEAEMGLSLLAVFLLRPLIERLPVMLRIGLALVGISLAAEQVVSHRKFAKNIMKPTPAAASIEYRTARWVAEHVPHARVWLPGSLGLWFNTWTAGQQMTGSSWSTAYNATHQKIVFQSLYSSDPVDAGNALLWLKAYGVQVAAIPGPNSPEFWKAIRRPELFAGCEVLWREDDTSLCHVPGASDSFAHVVPRDSLVRSEPRDWRDVANLRTYSSALSASPNAEWAWDSAGAAIIRAVAPRGSAVSIQVTHHPGWNATANGKAVAIHRDGLGLMWLDSPCDGPCEIRLWYTGGWELGLCRWLSILTLLTVVIWSLDVKLRRRTS
jgi:hypothetical protein